MLHSGRLYLYLEILDLEGKACQGTNALAYLASSSVTEKNVTDKEPELAKVLANLLVFD
jgi:hypothetical protein